MCWSIKVIVFVSYQNEKKSRTSFSEVWPEMPLTFTVLDMLLVCGLVWFVIDCVSKSVDEFGDWL